MNLVILHHHLNPGGVTRVVENHLRALATTSDSTRPDRVLLLHGGRCQDWPQALLADELPFELQIATIEGLDYDLTSAKPSDELGKRIHKHLTANDFTPQNTLLHWHNHALGKNASAPLAVAYLAGQGFPQLLQVHDFAEDFRPANYRYLSTKLASQGEPLGGLLYPQADRIHYAVLNGRDRAVLSEAGIANNKLHFLPNPVAQPPVAQDRSAARQLLCDALAEPTRAGDKATRNGDKPLVIYPVRGIRRKNLGELALWSAAYPAASFAVTLAPKNPAERASFDRWSDLAAELELDCHFGVPERTADGRPVSFADTLAAADYLLTTSVAEGFGMAFLECWLAGRKLLGRDLPEITADFKSLGVDLSSLYESLDVPTDWIDRDQYLREMRSLISTTYETFAVPAPTPDQMQQQLSQQIEQPTIDFARLPTSLQASVVRRVHSDPASRERLLADNPRFGGLTTAVEPATTELIRSNRQQVVESLSLESLGERLIEVYQQVFDSVADLPPIEPLRSSLTHQLPKPTAILSAFLSIDRLHALRVES